MMTGVLLTLAAGSFWSLSGVVNSCCAKYKLDIITYLLSNVLCSFLLSLIFCFDYSIPWNKQLAIMALIMIPAGISNTGGALFLQAALKRGHHGIIFLIANAAMVVPFLTGILFFRECPSLIQYGGAAAIFLGIFSCSVPKMKHGQNKNEANWFAYAIASFLCFGLAQTLMTMPSFPAFKEYAIPGSSKTTLLYLGCSLLMTMRSLGAIRKKELQFSKKLVICGILVSLCNLFSMYLMFYALDALAKAKLASMGFSLALSSSLVMFTGYSIFIIREKCYFMTLLGLILLIAGGLLLSVHG